jgi:hypothetical protein
MKLAKYTLLVPAMALLAFSNPAPAEARTKTILKYGAIGLGAAAIYQAGRQSSYGGGYYGGYYGGGGYYPANYGYYSYPSYSYYPSYGYGYYGGGYYY